MNCKEITQNINVIRIKKSHFDEDLKKGDMKSCLNLQTELRKILEEFWLTEILTKENIEKQYDEWKDMYRNLDNRYPFPRKEHIFEFFGKDFEFKKLMRTKEKQGFTKLIISPAPGFFSLKDFAARLERSIGSNGGANTIFYTAAIDNTDEEKDLRYFGSVVIEESNPIMTGGVSADEIKQNLDKYSICNGWMISFCANEKELVRRTEPDIDTGNGRKSIKTGLTPKEYLELYFSDKNEIYKGERSMIPQEYFALLLKDLHEKYGETGKKLSTTSDNFLGSDREAMTRFNDTYFSSDPKNLIKVFWDKTRLQFFCETSYIRAFLDPVGVRSVVRRSIKQ